MNKEELINISYFDNKELSIKEHCNTYRKIVNEIIDILRKYDIKFILGETEVCKDLQHQLEEKDKVIDEAISFIVEHSRKEPPYYEFLEFNNATNLSELLETLERGKNE